MKAISLFSSAGIGELRLPSDIDVVLANELLEKAFSLSQSVAYSAGVTADHVAA